MARAKKRTTAFHAQRDTSDMSINVVGFGNLRVLIVKDDDMWFAQCLDINYAAQGMSEAEVKANFERGLRATVDEHLRIYGNIENLLARAPSPRLRQEIVQRMPRAFRYSQVTFHRLPSQIQNAIRFEKIEFIRPNVAVA
jgi:hypothetical protein